MAEEKTQVDPKVRFSLTIACSEITQSRGHEILAKVRSALAGYTDVQVTATYSDPGAQPSLLARMRR